ncbi:MAG TPA: TlpA disulfide reductase family protein [Anaerolineales bacterium]|jgi:thiol-disulfide isomerase/thioredoxin|nr:TlpA disulfide reductase family protein [Anaerolineales bacterium]
MRKFTLILGSILLGGLALAACASGQSANNVMSDEVQNTSGTMSDEMSEEMSNGKSDEMSDEMTEDMKDDGMSDTADDMMSDNASEDHQEMPETAVEEDTSDPTWLDYQFTDAVTGETFSISGFKGKVVLVETMAMWCSNCMKQQIQVRELHEQLGERDDFIGIGIDVDLNEDLAMLAAYVQKNEFSWLYSVASTEVLAGIQDSLGGQFLNPPSTPIVLFDKEGNPHALPFGIKSADELLGFVEPFLN